MNREGRMAWRTAGLGLAAALLAGCSGGSITGSLPSVPTSLSKWGSNLFGDQPTGSTAMASAKDPTLPNMDDDCPGIDIRRGAGTLSVAATKANEQATANDLRYQLTFHQFARQCALDGRTIRMRVGVQGRVIVGPAGAPNQVDVPIRYAVVREGVDPQTIITKFRRLPVGLAPGATTANFTDIEEDLSFPLPPYEELQAYVVYVGFDEAGDRGERRPPAKKAAPKAPPRTQ
jgi:hypothetical protein